MKSIDFVLLFFICFLSLILLHKNQSALNVDTKSVLPVDDRLTRCAVKRLGFDPRRFQRWFDRRSYEMEYEFFNLMQQRDYSNRLLEEKRRFQTAFVLLLDGDDKELHYTRAARAHINALHTFYPNMTVLLLLNNDHFDQSYVRKHFEQADRVLFIDSLQYDEKRVALIKHVNKLQIWNMTEYEKLIFLDLDMVLFGRFDGDLLQQVGEPPSFLDNPENEYHFNSGVTVVRPSHDTFEKMLRTLHRYRSSWDYTDQSLVDVAIRSVFNLLPQSVCPKKRTIYTHPNALWRAGAGAKCVHWTGEKPWKFQKRKDLQELSKQWDKYLEKFLQQK